MSKTDLTISHNVEGGYRILASLALFFGLITVVALAMGAWVGAFFFYGLATAARLFAGAIMNRMGDAETVNAWNNRYHRYVVIVLNSVVGFVLLGRLAWDTFRHHMHIGPFALIVGAFIAYFIAARFTRPNTFGARVRSATLTIVILMIMAYLALGMQYYGLYLLGGVLALLTAWVRLAKLADRFGWADR